MLCIAALLIPLVFFGYRLFTAKLHIFNGKGTFFSRIDTVLRFLFAKIPFTMLMSFIFA